MRIISNLLKTKSSGKLLNFAIILAIITIGYNIIEGIISIFFGTQDETLALFGFGVDSFVEVISGMGEGRYYTEQTGYVEQFKEKLGYAPYPGTLNVEIEFIEKNKLRFLKNNPAIEISEFQTKNRTFGAVRCFRAEINGIKGAIVLPLRSHYSNILEFISPAYLREKLNLKDGDEVNIVIYFN